MPEIVAINLAERCVVLDDGEIVPIDTMIDSSKEETDDPTEALALVAGPTRFGMWLSVLVCNFGGTVH